MPDHLEFGEGLKPSPCDAAIRATYLGQAHIAGTGPTGKTCRECQHWAVPGHYAKGHKEKPGEIKCARCLYLIYGKARRKIPHDAVACRFFVQDDAPPPVLIIFEAKN